MQRRIQDFFKEGVVSLGGRQTSQGKGNGGGGGGGWIRGMFEYVDFSFILMSEEFLGTISNGNRTDWSTIQGVISE